MSRATRPHADPTVTEDAADVGLNLAVIWGTCSAPPEIRTLESGSRVASLAVRTVASRMSVPSG